MAQNITLLGASYPEVPAVLLPKTGGGTAQFDDTTDANATAGDIAQGKTAYVNGVKLTGTGSGGGGGAISIVDTPDAAGGTVRTITAVDISDTTAVAGDVAQGKYFYTAQGVKTAGTASGGGGGQYAWLGDGAEKVGTIIDRTINLKNDTDYDSWTASTTATTLIEASVNPDYTLTADIPNYDYCFVTRGYLEPVYVSGTPMTYTTKRVVQYYINYYYGYPSNSSIEGVQTDTATQAASCASNTAMAIQYYYNNVGIVMARSATQCGPIYMSSYPTLSMGTWADGKVPITYKLPAFYAKCDSSRFSTTRKEQVDSENTNYILTVNLYRVPHGKGLMSHWVSAMCADLNAV